MAKGGLTKECRALFPLKKIEDVVELLKNELAGPEPNIAVASIVLGALEHSLVENLSKRSSTSRAAPIRRGRKQKQRKKSVEAEEEKSPDPVVPDVDTDQAQSPATPSTPATNNGTGDADENFNKDSCNENDFPPLELDIVLGLYDKFQTNLQALVDKTLYSQKQEDEKNGVLGTSIDLVKNVSNVVWNSLSKTYNADKPHLQNLFTYLTGNQLDRFGVAFAVVAAAQILGLNDVHLVLSEDHAWVTFGHEEKLNLEVTWHGDATKDKRGSPVGEGGDEGSWLYLNGSPVICDRHMEIAAIVSSINIALNQNMECVELCSLQQQLLWTLYDAGHVKKYPKALCILAELEATLPTPSRKSCVDLYEEAITAARTYYDNKHIHPYLYSGRYHYKQLEFKLALESWADGADVIKKYKYTKNDYAIYNQFYEITKSSLMSIMKQSSSGISATSILRDPGCFAALLRFFDGICQWEENGQFDKVVIHIGWAESWVKAIGKFERSIRKQVTMLSERPANGIESMNAVEAKSKKILEQPETTDVNGNKEKVENKSQPSASPGPGCGVMNSGRGSGGLNVKSTSFKMLELQDLVFKDRLNTNALQLVLTAQPIKIIPALPSAATSEKPGMAEVGVQQSRKSSKRVSTEDATATAKEAPLIESNGGAQPLKKRARSSRLSSS